MKLQIKMTDEQLALMIQALELNFRFLMGQGSIVSDLLSESVFPNKENYSEEEWRQKFDKWLKDREQIQTLVDDISTMLNDDSQPYGLPKDTHRMSDMWSALRHVQWLLLDNKNDTWDVRSTEPFRMGDYPMIKVEVIEE